MTQKVSWPLKNLKRRLRIQIKALYNIHYKELKYLGEMADFSLEQVPSPRV